MDTIWPILEPILLIVFGLLVTKYLAKYVGNATDRERAVQLDRIADSVLAMIRLNNPGNVILEKVQYYENELFEKLLGDPATTNNTAVLKRATAAAISRAIVNDGAVVDEAIKAKIAPLRPAPIKP